MCKLVTSDLGNILKLDKIPIIQNNNIILK